MRAALALTAATLLAGASCNQAIPEAAAEGGRPLTHEEPVGPIPGPGDVESPAVDRYADDPAAARDGRRYFLAFNCAGCHGDHGGGGMGPSLRDRDWIYGNTPGKIHASIVQGRAHGMPSWGTLLPDDTVWKITAYIQTLATPQEPEPPQ
ncbi:MAG TPA: c-type cytochrome [Candidatus Polarisedimenticolaceae bacterium]|nr:c-type cytochrome [Candidatus Polarisedimenticolaceae bacterium]